MNVNHEINGFRSQFMHSLTRYCGLNPGDGVLVAVSGGADSIALLHLFASSGFRCVVAHCNFALRGAESDGDEDFVIKICNELGVGYRVKKFDTRGYASNRKISIEMAARELRYSWFEELLRLEGLSSVATGHHGNDAIETFFLNLVRGTGIKGLKGMSWRRGVVIRPLLFASGVELVDYCNARGIDFRTDSTNTDTRLHRNKIRHQVIPLLVQINPSFFSTMQLNMKLLAEAHGVLIEDAELFKNQSVVIEGDRLLLPVSTVKDHPRREGLLFEIFHPYGFNSSVINDIARGLDGIPGRQYFSETHRLVIDRFNLVLVKREVGMEGSFYIQAGESLVTTPVKLSVKIFERSPDFQFSTNPGTVHLDAALIDFPLEVRRWRNGDHFQPLGMSKFKKLSDFFVDSKYSLVDKERAWLLVANNEIIWIIGKRADNRYKITPKTRLVLEVGYMQD